MYADDKTLLFKSSNTASLQSHMNDSLSKMAHWFKANKFTLNIKRTKYMLFGTRHTLNSCDDILLMYGNDITERVDKFKYLVVIFDPLLAWSEHVNYISSVVSKRIDFIRRVKFYLPPSTLNLIAKVLVFPHFDYCSPVCSNCISELCNSLQILQNKLARILLSADIYTPILDMMNTLHWDKLCEKWNKQILLLFFSNVLKMMLHLTFHQTLFSLLQFTQKVPEVSLSTLLFYHLGIR